MLSHCATKQKKKKKKWSLQKQEVDFLWCILGKYYQRGHVILGHLEKWFVVFYQRLQRNPLKLWKKLLRFCFNFVKKEGALSISSEDFVVSFSGSVVAMPVV